MCCVDVKQYLHYKTEKTFNIVFVKLVALLHRTEASILPDGPGSVGVHGWIGPSSERKHSRQLICAASRVCLRVHGLDV